MKNIKFLAARCGWDAYTTLDLILRSLNSLELKKVYAILYDIAAEENQDLSDLTKPED